jgi:hypothetical protein
MIRSRLTRCAEAPARSSRVRLAIEACDASRVIAAMRHATAAGAGLVAGFSIGAYLRDTGARHNML